MALSQSKQQHLRPCQCHSVLKCKGQIKSSYSRKPMVVSCQLGQVGWRSTLGTSTFGLLCLFNGHKLPENAIKRPFMAISGSGGSKWLDLSGYWLDLGGIHPGWSVGAIWTHRNCPGGLQGGQKWPKNAIKQAFLAIGCSGGSKWLDLSVWEALRRESTVWFIFGAL